jgi:hypothetical protein
METELSLAVRAFETGHKLPAKNASQNFHWQEESVLRLDPGRLVGR